MWLSKQEYETRERRQNIRSIVLDFTVPALVAGFVYVVLSGRVGALYDDMTGITDQRIERQEIGQILRDEGLKRCQYSDTLGNATIGVGHLVTGDMPHCISERVIVDTLISDYRYARDNVQKRYPWATGEVKLILVNMSFQLGENRLAKFTGMLSALERGDYTTATVELLDSTIHRQAPKRIERHAARILSLSDDVR